MRTCLGGTFDPFHKGHKALLRAAASGSTHLFVGVSDAGLADRRGRTVAPLAERAGRIERFLRDEAGYEGDLVLQPLRDASGPAARDPFDRIVVSPETLPRAVAINARRAASRLPAMRIEVVPHVLGHDLLPVSGTRIARGDIDAEGYRLRPVRVAAGTTNEAKLRAIQQEFAQFLGLEVDVQPVQAASGVPEQPQDEQTLQGALARARAAAASKPEADYAVGVEAGLLRMAGESRRSDVQACAVLDTLGWETTGWGPGFHYPQDVEQRALGGETVSAILGPRAGDARIGSTTGAIGYLTGGRMDRAELTRLAVRMALVPRVRRELYVG
ncbi:MAG TPA: inosine/xanthosine triphosphatase [Candidatus Thermoplasmatota archaeon]|nr:inosine/xanthosine triphosphatase [Candidatus Thermoplasmatota archaeon]